MVLLNWQGVLWQAGKRFAGLGEAVWIVHLKIAAMIGANEISLVLGILASGLFLWKFRYYEIQLEKEEMLEKFLRE